MLRKVNISHPTMRFDKKPGAFTFVDFNEAHAHLPAGFKTKKMRVNLYWIYKNETTDAEMEHDYYGRMAVGQISMEEN